MMKKIVTRVLFICLYLFLLIYAAGFQIIRILDLRGIVAVTAGMVLFSVPVILRNRKIKDDSEIAHALSRNAIFASYLTTFIFLFSRLNSNVAYENLLSDIALNCRPILYGFVYFLILRPDSRKEQKKRYASSNLDCATSEVYSNEMDSGEMNSGETNFSEMDSDEINSAEMNAGKMDSAQMQFSEAVIVTGAPNQEANQCYNHAQQMNKVEESQMFHKRIVKDKELDPEQLYYRFRSEGLTQREAEVAKLVYNRMSNREIAEQLYISETTVKKHVSHIFEKLQINTRQEIREIINR